MKICNTCKKQYDSDSRYCPGDGTPLVDIPEDPLSALIGKVLNRTYQIEDKLGQGGMGAVFRAKHMAIGDVVAIKVISPEHTQNKSVLNRFRREAQAVRRLAHPNAVAVHDFNMTEDGLLFMVMEYVNGQTLEDYLKKQTFLSPKRALEIFKPVTAALQVAHNLGIIHRDIKPANLMICHDTGNQEQMKVLDFGTARLNVQDGDGANPMNMAVTIHGQICGTPVYMAPEQIMDEGITPATDIYALGVVLYQMLTGSVPFMGKHVTEIMMAHINTIPDPPSTRLAELNPEFDAVILKALEKKPEDRYQSVTEMADALATTVASCLRGQFQNAKASSEAPQTRTDALIAALSAQPDFGQFVKREEELKRLQTSYLNASEGKARPTFIIGSPGIGKTQLITRFQEWAEKKQVKVLNEKFFDYSSNAHEPLQPFKNMLTLSLRHTEKEPRAFATGDLKDMLRQRFGMVAALNEGDVDKWQVFEELNTAFTSLAKDQPLIIIIDDLQWADTLSLEYLGYLLRNSQQLRICFIGSARAEEAAQPGHPLQEFLVEQVSYFPYERMELTPFDPDTIDEWLQRVFRYIDIEPEDIQQLHKITDGNPFYLSEVIRLLMDSKKIVFQDNVWRCGALDKVKVPHSIDSIVKYKLKNCAPELRQLLSPAAVIGDDFKFELLQMVSNLDEVEMEKLLVDGVKAFLLKEEDVGIPGDYYRFYQSTIRYVIYEEIPHRQRRRLHLQVAESLTKLFKGKLQKVAAAITHHYHAASDWQQAYQTGAPAIEQAWSQQGFDEVIKLAKLVEEALTNLIKETPTDEFKQGLAQVKLRRLAALTYLARFEEAESESQNAKELIAELKVPALDIRLQGILIELSFWGNRYKEGITIGQAALKLARETDEEKSATSLMFYLGMCQARVGKLSEALATFEELNWVSVATGDRDSQANAMTGLGFFIHFTGEWRKSREYLAKAIELARACNNRYIECMALVFWNWATEYECLANRVEELFQEGMKVARACGWRNLEGYCYFVAGRYHGNKFKPDPTKAQELLSRGLAIMQETNDRVGQLQIANAFATTEARVKPSPEIAEKLKHIISTLTKNGETLTNCRTRIELGNVEMKLERWDEALTTFHGALQLAEYVPIADGQWRAHYGLALCYKHKDDEAAALNHMLQAIAVINKLQQEFESEDELANFMEDKEQVYIAYADLCS